MLLLVDENIPFAVEAFRQFGEVRLVAGRNLRRADVQDAAALIVRSVTRVNAELLEGTSVRFVGTATVGTDHLDIPFLDGAGITWCSAAGSNARSVVEWVLAALAEHCLAMRTDWRGATLGIVGHGNIGSRLAPVARALGMNVLINDPPLHREGRMAEHVELFDLLRESDFVTLHVPYTREGTDATHHMIGWEELDRMKPRAALLNASRGAVLDNAAAREFALGEALVFLLDVFEGEPRPNRELAQRALICTPHIAGYSFEGKVNGTRIMAESLGRFLGQPSAWMPVFDAPLDNIIALDSAPPMLTFQTAIGRAYDIQLDNNNLREGLMLEDEAARGAHFDALRKNYRRRREFANYTVRPTGDARLDADLTAMGFVLLAAF